MLKPIKNNVGECKCCEDPMTNLLNSMKGEFAQFEGIGFALSDPGRIFDVGEGIVTIDFGDIGGFLTVVSTCYLTKIVPTNQQQINSPSRFSGFLPPVN